jgi:hypothetical protein
LSCPDFGIVGWAVARWVCVERPGYTAADGGVAIESGLSVGAVGSVVCQAAESDLSPKSASVESFAELFGYATDHGASKVVGTVGVADLWRGISAEKDTYKSEGDREVSGLISLISGLISLVSGLISLMSGLISLISELISLVSEPATSSHSIN